MQTDLFLSHLREELRFRRDPAALVFLRPIVAASRRDLGTQERLAAWCENGSTLRLRELIAPFADYRDLAVANIVDRIDAATLRVPDREEARGLSQIQRLAIEIGAEASAVRGEDLGPAYAFCSENIGRMSGFQLAIHDCAILDREEDMAFAELVDGLAP